MIFDGHCGYSILFYYTFSVITGLMEGSWFLYVYWLLILLQMEEMERKSIKQNYAVAFCSLLLHGDLALGVETNRKHQHHTPSPLRMEAVWRLKSIRIPTAPPSGKNCMHFTESFERAGVHKLFLNYGLK